MQYIKVSDIVNELCVASQDDDRSEFLRYLILSKSVLRDLKVKYINDFERKYLPIDPKTMTVRLPFNYMRFRTISIIEECRDSHGRCTEKVIPLTSNPYINITPIPKSVGSCNVCGCDATHPVCVELDSYTTLCEEVMIDDSQDPPLTGTKQTVLKTCANGDIIKEVTQPTQKWIKGAQQCDYTIDISNVNIEFPYTVVSYNKNNVDVVESPPITITNQDEQDSFFSDLGFTKVDSTNYKLSSTTDVYFSLLIEFLDASPVTELTINFAQSNCTYPLISDGISNAITTDVLCNVDVKSCGCIDETPSNIEKIVSCCAPFLNCCQSGELNDWNGWGIVPPSCPTNSPQPYNIKGTYNIDEKNFIIYLDSVNATKVLLAYDTDGSCDGDYAIPDYMLDPFKAGLAWLHSQYNESVSPSRRRELKDNYAEELMKVDKIYLDPLNMADLIGALKTPRTPY